MGDRANIYVVDEKPDSTGLTRGIYLYTHYYGSSWPENLRKALCTGPARNRWDDSQYLVRILVAHLFEDLGLGETGGGISTLRGDNEYPITILDTVNKRVAFAEEGQEGEVDNWMHVMSFQDFCDQVEAQYP